MLRSTFLLILQDRDGQATSEAERLPVEALHRGTRHRCWEVDILPPAIIERDIGIHIEGWLNRKLWDRREAEIERARELL